MSEIIENSPARIGQALHDLRRKRGLSAHDVAGELDVRSGYVMAPEKIDADGLPSIGYVPGYVRAIRKSRGLSSTALCPATANPYSQGFFRGDNHNIVLHCFWGYGMEIPRLRHLRESIYRSLQSPQWHLQARPDG
ncbi:MAG: helix-turn-helix domain-containing protein [Hyphomonadaceae bacterium]|nr:helix-turn-helix domain-containing protein [Hyphomonadaceae bacterium]